MDQLDLAALTDAQLIQTFKKLQHQSFRSLSQSTKWIVDFLQENKNQIVVSCPFSLKIEWVYLKGDVVFQATVREEIESKNLDSGTLTEDFCEKWRNLRFTSVDINGPWDSNNEISEKINAPLRILEKYRIQADELYLFTVLATKKMLEVLKPTELLVLANDAAFKFSDFQGQLKILQKEAVSITCEYDLRVLQICQENFTRSRACAIVFENPAPLADCRLLLPFMQKFLMAGNSRIMVQLDIREKMAKILEQLKFPGMRIYSPEGEDDSKWTHVVIPEPRGGITETIWTKCNGPLDTSGTYFATREELKILLDNGVDLRAQPIREQIIADFF